MKKINLAVLLILTMILGLMPFSSVLATEAPTISVTVSTPDSNGEFNATVSISGNPGIAFLSLRLHFDKAKLEPVSITKGSALSAGSLTSNINAPGIDYVTAVWSDAVGSDANGTLFTVKFKAKQEAFGKTNLGLSAHGIFDKSDEMNPVNVVLSDAEVCLLMYGDVNNDGKVDIADLLLLARYLAGHNVYINTEAAKVTPGEGRIGINDLLLLARYLAGHNVVLGS